MKWLLVIVLSITPDKPTFVAPQLTFYSQTACQMAIVDMELYLKQFDVLGMTCVSVPDEAEA